MRSLARFAPFRLAAVGRFDCNHLRFGPRGDRTCSGHDTGRGGGAVASSVRESGSKVKVRGVNDVLKPDKVVHSERSSWLSLRAHRKARGCDIPSLLCLPSVAGARVCGLLQGERELEQNAWFVFTCVVVHEHAFEPDGRVESYGC